MDRRTLSVVAFVAAMMLGIGLIGAASPVSAQEDSVTVELQAQDDSGVTGEAVLTADGDQTIVTVQLEGSEAGYEGHIFDSTCDDHKGATVSYAIEAVDDEGRSESTVDAPLGELTSGDFWVHIHRPAGERGVGVACGQVPAADGTGGELPSTGVGSLAESRSNSWLVAGLLAALVAFAGSIALRTRRFNG